MLGTSNDILRIKGEEKISWATFDHIWYLKTYPDVKLITSVTDPRSVLHFYLVTGQQIGHSPNQYFDEKWYLRQYPDAAAAVLGGSFASGFDEYCRFGYLDRSPHWLYTDYVYRDSSKLMEFPELEKLGYANRYDHFLRTGSKLGLFAHQLFDPVYYRSKLNDLEATQCDQEGAFHHFLRQIPFDKNEKPTSIYFYPDWYLERYREIAGQIGHQWSCALNHYLSNSTPTQFDPLPEFSESCYLTRYTDVATTVAEGKLRNGYYHFLNNGAFELRSPNETIDLRSYVSRCGLFSSVAPADCAINPFGHLLAFVEAVGLKRTP